MTLITHPKASTENYTVFLDMIGMSFTYPEINGTWRVNVNSTIDIDLLDLKNQRELMSQLNSKNTTPAQNFIENIKQIDIMPFSRAEIRYSDNCWDFSKYTTLNVERKNFRFNFEGCAVPFQDDLKNFVLLSVLENHEKIQSTHKKFYSIKNFLNSMASKGYYHVKDISDDDIKDYIASFEDSSAEKQRWTRTSLKGFFIIYSTNFEDILNRERLAIFELGSYALTREVRRKNRIKDIPIEYFDYFVSTMLNTMNDASLPRETRAIAAVYLILSQTGLRTGELLSLKKGCLQEIQVFENTTAYFLNFQTWKREKGNNVSTWQKTYVNQITKKAYDVLMTIEEPHRQKLEVDYLYTGNDGVHKTSFPLTHSHLTKFAETLFPKIKDFKCIDLDEKQTEGFRRKEIIKLINGKHQGTGHYFVIPHNHQFRVHVCTELINRGVPLKYVQKFMTHLSAEMTAGYYRENKAKEEEKRLATDKTIRMLINGETKPVGIKGNKLSEDIQKFISDGKFNIATDMDEIVENLNKNLVINPKTGGLCIKSPLLRCSVEGKSNEYYCAYNVCPNLYDFFYMADVAYRQCKELDEAIKINYERGFKREAQKQCNMLNTISANKLLPELDELQKVVERKGLEFVIENYPDLGDIIENYNSVKQEAEEWKTKKIC